MVSVGRSSELTCLSAFTGLGGMDLGLEAAGFRHVGCIEWDHAARRSLKANRGERWPVLATGDIEEAADTLKPEDLSLSAGDLDLLVGAPPCQPYSKAAQWAAGTRLGLEDRRGRYLDDFLQLVQTFLPKVVVIENVRGFVLGSTSALPYLAAELARMEATTGVTYACDHRLLDAHDYGVPQHRVRAIVVLRRCDTPFQWPAARSPVVAWDAIGPLRFDDDPPRCVGKWADLVPSIPEGHNYLWHTNRGGGRHLFGYRTRYWSFLLKLAKDRPSWTLPASPGPATGPFHWDNRPLRIEELLRLQSFPADWQVEAGSRPEAVRQVGNATPPLLAEAVGRSVATMLDGRDFASALTLAIPTRRPIPPASIPAPVPQHLLKFEGTYEDHPGHGNGPGAVKAISEADKV